MDSTVDQSVFREEGPKLWHGTMVPCRKVRFLKEQQVWLMCAQNVVEVKQPRGDILHIEDHGCDRVHVILNARGNRH